MRLIHSLNCCLGLESNLCALQIEAPGEFFIFHAAMGNIDSINTIEICRYW